MNIPDAKAGLRVRVVRSMHKGKEGVILEGEQPYCLLSIKMEDGQNWTSTLRTRDIEPISAIDRLGKIAPR